MNNSVRQTSNKSLIHMGDWYVGLYVDDDGRLSVYIDHDKGMVVSYNYDRELAEDDYQWAQLFYSKELDPKTEHDRISTKNYLRRKMSVKVNKKNK